MRKTNIKTRLVPLLTLMVASLMLTGVLAAGPGARPKRPTPMIHATDLYHPHADPDDHYDLASIYALNNKGLIDIKGILIDYPGNAGLNDPDIMAVAQMNYCTGLSVPAMVGTSHRMNNRNDVGDGSDQSDLQGINWLLNSMRNSPHPVVVNIVGTCTDVAMALKKDPELFRKKCKAIYLNAGSAYVGADKRKEYNVELNPSAYAAIFDAPCPVYWMPCFNMMNKGIGEYGTYYQFLQGDLLPFLAPKLQNYFLFMLDRKPGNNWFSYLNGKPDAELMAKYSKLMRGMWCTAGFLHSAGLMVTTEGEIVDLNSDKKPVCSFLPVDVTCDDTGSTTWKLAKHSTNRFIYHVDDLSKYEAAMGKALKSLLK